MFSPRARKVWLIVHVAASVGWLGAALTFLALDVTTVVQDDSATLRGGYVAMHVITTWAIVPLAWAALTTGVVLALGTPWGLFRHYWVVVSLALTTLAVVVLMAQLPIIQERAAQALAPQTTDVDLRAMGNLLLHSVGGSAVLIAIQILNMVKPKGLTPYGWRKHVGRT